MLASVYQDIRENLRELYVEDTRPWLAGFSGGKDSTMLASLVFDAVLSAPADQRKKPVAILCTDTRVEIPAIIEMIESTLARMHKFSQQNGLNVEVKLLKPPPEQSFWVNIIGVACRLASWPIASTETPRWLVGSMPGTRLSAICRRSGGC
ncbi:MAG: hypothetical protein HZA21_05235 [Nitrospirae bacterium]|nr:hypothetical protein [Nitrospirota bacterium]